MDRGQRSLVACVHGLQHVKSFFATHLTNHDSVRPHTQAVDYQLPLPDRTLALNVRRTGFQAHYVLLFHLQLSGVFDGHYPL